MKNLKILCIFILVWLAIALMSAGIGAVIAHLSR